MKNISKKLFATICALLLMLSALIIPAFGKEKAYAAEVEEYSILSPTFANTLENLITQGIDESEIDDFTPYDETNYIRFSGNSIKPAIAGEEGYKIIDTTLNIANKIDDINLASKDTTNFV